MEALRPGTGKLAEVDVTTVKKHGESVLFDFVDRLGQTSQGFVLKWHETWVAYENRCPHWSIPLDENALLDQSQQMILCPMHGALFEVDTGSCISGPCMDDHLRKFDVRESEQSGHLEIWAITASVLRF